MSRPSNKEPIVICSKAAQRLAAIYRQHRPDQPALAVVSQLGKAFAERGAAEQTSTVRTAVLDGPLSCASSTRQPQITDWQNLRDAHSELYVTCHTLRRLQLLHGTLVEVLLPHKHILHTSFHIRLSRCHNMSAGVSFTRQLWDCSPGQDPGNRCRAKHSHAALCTSAKS